MRHLLPFLLILILSCAEQVDNKELSYSLIGRNLKIYGKMGNVDFCAMVREGSMDMKTKVISGEGISLEVDDGRERTLIYAESGKYFEDGKKLQANNVNVKGKFKLNVDAVNGSPEVDGTLYLEGSRGSYENFRFKAERGILNIKERKGIFFNPEVEIVK